MEEEVDPIMSIVETISEPVIGILRQYSTLIIPIIIGYFIGDWIWSKYKKKSAETEVNESEKT